MGLLASPDLGGYRRIGRANRGEDVSKSITKPDIIREIGEQLANEVSHNDIKRVLDALADVGRAQLKQSGAFHLPGFAISQVTEEAAVPEHEDINPFTKEPMTFKAKPA
jgi:DNA-binding protein HU-beta